jgi:hypothetical protein
MKVTKLSVHSVCFDPEVKNKMIVEEIFLEKQHIGFFKP